MRECVSCGMGVAMPRSQNGGGMRSGVNRRDVSRLEAVLMEMVVFPFMGMGKS